MDSVLDGERERSLLSSAWKVRIAFLAAVVVINRIALWLAWEDRSWGALGIAVMYGPIANGVLALASLLAIPFLKRKDPLFSPGLPCLDVPGDSGSRGDRGSAGHLVHGAEWRLI